MTDGFTHELGLSGGADADRSAPTSAALFDEFPAGPRPHGDTQLWMVTFADLAALVLAFFVLLYSMSRIDEQSWQQLVDGVANGAQLDLSNEQSVDGPAADQQLVNGASLNYVSALLKQQADQSSAVHGLVLDASGQSLVIDFELSPDFLQNGAAFDAETDAMFEALARVLGATENALEIVILQPSVPPSLAWNSAPWIRDLEIARLVLHQLKEAGYRRSVGVSIQPFTAHAPKKANQVPIVRLVADKFIGRPVQP